MEEQNNVKIPKKRVTPIVIPTVEDEVVEKKTAAKKSVSKESTKKTTTPKETTKKTTVKKAEEKKPVTKTSTKKTTTSKNPAKKTTAKKTVKPKIDEKSITSVKIDPRTGTIRQEKTPKQKVETPVVTKPVVEKTTVKKPKKPTIKSKDVTIEPPARDNTPKEIVRPTPKKTKVLNKEEKILYKNLQESFNTVANMAMVIEERTMDTKQIPDLTIGELHVIEMVNKYNNKPMTLIAKKMHVTVGSLTIGVNRLVQKGYLLRIRDEMDHRVILLSITQLGKKVLKTHDKFHDDILGLVLDTIPLQQAAKVMSQFAYILELYYDPSIAAEEEKKTTRKGKK